MQLQLVPPPGTHNGGLRHLNGRVVAPARGRAEYDMVAPGHFKQPQPSSQ